MNQEPLHGTKFFKNWRKRYNRHYANVAIKVGMFSTQTMKDVVLAKKRRAAIQDLRQELP